MSLYPYYKRMVRGSSLDPNDLDFYNRRSLRSHSALPDSLYLRGYDSLPNSLAQRALSTAREFTEEPAPPMKSRDFIDYYDTTDTISRLNASLRRSDDYWVDRYASDIYPTPRHYGTYFGTEYPLLSSRRRFPSSYWSYYPYSTTLPNYFNYGKRYWSLDDPLNDYYLHGSPYTSSPGISSTRLRWRDLNKDYPSRIGINYYRPRYTSVRNSYLYPRYI